MSEMQLDDKLAKALDECSHFVPKSIQEEVFVRDFLPMFVGEEAKDLRLWIDMAGGPFNPVDVYRQEEWLFRVPALADDRDDALKGLSGVSVQTIVTEAKMMSASLPALGDAVINEKLRVHMGENPISLNTIAAWNEIFKRYNKPLINLSPELDGAVQSQALAENNGAVNLAMDDDNSELL